MKLNLEKNEIYDSEYHTGVLFPGAESREFSYQGESISTEYRIRASNPRRCDGKLNQELEEDQHDWYELVICRHTGKHLSFKLIAHRDVKLQVRDRDTQGFATTADVLETGMTFGELCNRIFGVGRHTVYHEAEGFPDEVKQALKGAYSLWDEKTRDVALEERERRLLAELIKVRDEIEQRERARKERERIRSDG